MRPKNFSASGVELWIEEPDHAPLPSLGRGDVEGGLIIEGGCRAACAPSVRANHIQKMKVRQWR